MSQEIIDTRKIGFGSSDADMLAKVGIKGELTNAAKERIALMLGLKEHNNFSTNATRLGHEIENVIFEGIKSYYPNCISNPLNKLKNSPYSFEIFNHIDIEFEDENSINWIECKATKDSLSKTLEKYRYQLSHHDFLGQRKANELGKTFVLKLAHYDTNGYNGVFDADKLLIVDVIGLCDKYVTDIIKGCEIIENELTGFQYTPKEEISISELPKLVQSKCELMAESLKTIDELTKKVDEFKANLTKIMIDNNIKSIKNEYISFTLVIESEAVKFDSKLFKEENQVLYKKYQTKKELKKAYIKTTLKI